jgi:hypothetical protein
MADDGNDSAIIRSASQRQRHLLVSSMMQIRIGLETLPFAVIVNRMSANDNACDPSFG